jgi:hypothetical protein
MPTPLRSALTLRRIGWLGVLVAVVCWTWSVLAQAAPTGSIPESIRFNRDIRPILSEKCFRCHGPDSGTRRADLRLDSAEAVAKNAARNTPQEGVLKVIAPGDPDRSTVMHRITATDPKRRMPFNGDPLSEREVQLIRRWIEQGAKYEPVWSFMAPVRPELPTVSNPAWAKNPIDAFILARLDHEGLKPSPKADRATLLRRVTFDLTGLPPTLAEIDAFLADTSPNAYEKVVDRLLASPRYGERMAAAWLAAARFSDSYGMYFDHRKEMSPWRDWVINAFNQNKHFDQFTIEQLAGDLLPNATLEQKIGSGFNRNHRMTSEGGSIEAEMFAENIAERVATTGTVWLGLTVGCARCHDHKFDPIKQKEFYQFGAFFNSMPESGLAQHAGNTPPLIYAPNPEQQAKLKAFDEQIATIEKQLTELRPTIKRLQREWERTLSDSNPSPGARSTV